MEAAKSRRRRSPSYSFPPKIPRSSRFPYERTKGKMITNKMEMHDEMMLIQVFSSGKEMMLVTAQPKSLLGQNRPCAHVCVQGARESNFSLILVRQEELDQLK